MGAADFSNVGRGKTPDEAFDYLVTEARYEHGHGGYTGTIAEKHSFISSVPPADVEPRQWARWIETADNEGDMAEVPAKYRSLIRKANDAYEDKWGPAVCVPLGDGKYLFIGWASS